MYVDAWSLAGIVALSVGFGVVLATVGLCSLGAWLHRRATEQARQAGAG